MCMHFTERYGLNDTSTAAPLHAFLEHCLQRDQACEAEQEGGEGAAERVGCGSPAARGRGVHQHKIDHLPAIETLSHRSPCRGPLGTECSTRPEGGRGAAEGVGGGGDSGL